MVQMDYPIVVLPLGRENGGGYVAYAKDLPGCLSDGQTPAEALSELRKAIEEWIAEAVRLGKDVPLPGSASERAKSAKEALQSVIARQRELIEK